MDMAAAAETAVAAEATRRARLIRDIERELQSNTTASEFLRLFVNFAWANGRGLELQHLNQTIMMAHYGQQGQQHLGLAALNPLVAGQMYSRQAAAAQAAQMSMAHAYSALGATPGALQSAYSMGHPAQHPSNALASPPQQQQQQYHSPLSQQQVLMRPSQSPAASLASMHNLSLEEAEALIQQQQQQQEQQHVDEDGKGDAADEREDIDSADASPSLSPASSAQRSLTPTSMESHVEILQPNATDESLMVEERIDVPVELLLGEDAHSVGSPNSNNNNSSSNSKHSRQSTPVSSNQRAPGPGYICKFCGEMGSHWFQQCPKAPLRTTPGPGYVCKFCDAEGDHWFQQCPNKPARKEKAKKATRRRSGPGETYVCKICGETGAHWYQQCPKAVATKVTVPGETYVCKFCGEAGKHWFQQCPQNPKLLKERDLIRRRSLRVARAKT